MLKRAIALVLVAGMLVTCSARAATPSTTVTLTWTNPSQNVDGTALTDLDHVTIYWQRCNVAVQPLAFFGAIAGSLAVATTATGASMSQVVTVPLAKPVCFELTATNTSGLTSNPSAVVAVTAALPTPGQPVQLN